MSEYLKRLEAGLATFAAFFGAGLIPLVPFLLTCMAVEDRFDLSARVTGIALFGIGLAKGAALHRSMVRSGLETLLIGGLAAVFG